MIERYLLRYFLAVVDHGNFSRAAVECNVSQPTLSVGVAKLEEALGTRLFFRSNQRVQLTEAGTRFLAHARRIEREFNLAIQDMGTAGGANAPRAILRLGLLSSIPGSLVARAFGEPVEVARHQPAVEVKGATWTGLRVARGAGL